MSSNEIILLEAILEDYKQQLSGNLKSHEIFELFSADQILKESDLPFSDIEEGIVDGGLDGGIDGFYMFTDGELIRDLEDVDNVRRNVKIDIWIIQSKMTMSFEATVLDKIIVTIEQIFDFSKLDGLTNELNENILSKARLFKEVYRKTASRFPELSINYCYSTRGSTNNIHFNVKSKEKILIDKTSELFKTAKARVNFKYYGVNELLELQRKEKSYTLTLKLNENPIVAKEGYLALVDLNDYYNFITDDNNNLRRYIFDLNVRDYQGAVEVNKDIEYSLEHDKNINFWVLNNGVTILADKGSAVAKDLTLENVQIVNGLQTSTSIYNYLKKTGVEHENRSLLIKIIIKEDADVIDKVIKSSNFQTPIAIASLKATDLFQRELEEYFKKNDLFYDRRKGYYKNIGKSPDKIISISSLAQSIIAIVHKEPDFSRARPSSLLKKEDDYKKVFNNNLPFNLYLFCAKLMIYIQSYLRNDFGEKINGIKLNFKYHIAYATVAFTLSKSDYHFPDLLSLNIDSISYDNLDKSIKWISEKVYNYHDDNAFPMDTIAKSAQFIKYLSDRLNIEFGYKR